MAQPKSFFRVFTESGPLIAVATAVALLLGIAGPALGQGFFNFGGPPQRPQPQQRNNGGGFGGGPGGWFGGDLFAPFQQQQAPRQQRVIREDFSRAPPPEKRDPAATPPERSILVLGDGMADWLAYGLEDAYADQPDMGVIRRHKTFSGLIRYQPKGDPADWAAAAKGILATEKPEAIVVMLGLNDRVAIREPAAEKSDGKSSDSASLPIPSLPIPSLPIPSLPIPSRRTKRLTRRMPKPNRTASPPTELRIPTQNPTTRRSIASCRRRMPPTMATRRRRSRRGRARARRTASMNFARSAGSNSTPRRSRR